MTSETKIMKIIHSASSSVSVYKHFFDVVSGGSFASPSTSTEQLLLGFGELSSGPFYSLNFSSMNDSKVKMTKSCPGLLVYTIYKSM